MALIYSAHGEEDGISAVWRTLPIQYVHERAPICLILQPPTTVLKHFQVCGLEVLDPGMDVFRKQMALIGVFGRASETVVDIAF